MSSLSDLLVRAKTGDRVALSKLISVLERQDTNAEEIMKAINTSSSPYIVSFVGPPGAGKSTLIASVSSMISSTSGEKIAIISIDPSSPLYGGAILGNRIRMLGAISDNVYMRSFSSGSMIGGLSRSVFSVVKLLGYCGYTTVLLEGVGAGQLDYKPLIYSHTRVVVLTPLSGDLVQMIKSGVMELGDIYVINKADQPGGDVLKALLEEAIRARMSVEASEKMWKPAVILTIALKGVGINELAQYIKKHREYLLQTGLLTERDKAMRELELKELAIASISDALAKVMSEDWEAREIVNKYIEGKILLTEAVSTIIKKVFSRWC